MRISPYFISLKEVFTQNYYNLAKLTIVQVDPVSSSNSNFDFWKFNSPKDERWDDCQYTKSTTSNTTKKICTLKHLFIFLTHSIWEIQSSFTYSKWNMYPKLILFGLKMLVQIQIQSSFTYSKWNMYHKLILCAQRSFLLLNLQF